MDRRRRPLRVCNGRGSSRTAEHGRQHRAGILGLQIQLAQQCEWHVPVIVLVLLCMLSWYDAVRREPRLSCHFGQLAGEGKETVDLDASERGRQVFLDVSN